jgi:hypothetical protein
MRSVDYPQKSFRRGIFRGKLTRDRLLKKLRQTSPLRAPPGWFEMEMRDRFPAARAVLTAILKSGGWKVKEGKRKKGGV